MKKAKSNHLEIGKMVFRNRIYRRKRVQRYRMEGIRNRDQHDRDVHKMYRDVLRELKTRVGGK